MRQHWLECGSATRGSSGLRAVLRKRSLGPCHHWSILGQSDRKCSETPRWDTAWGSAGATRPQPSDTVRQPGVVTDALHVALDVAHLTTQMKCELVFCDQIPSL